VRSDEPLQKSEFDMTSDRYTHLSPDQKYRLSNLLDSYNDIFSHKGELLSKTSKVRHQINTGDNPPTHCQPHRVSQQQATLIRNEIDTMLSEGIIEPSNSPWSSPW
jgi:hypothetical protein